VFEVLLYKALLNFIKETKILSNRQFGFQLNTGTFDAPIELFEVSHIYTNNDNNNILMSQLHLHCKSLNIYR